MIKEKYLTPKETADLIDVNVKTLYRWEKQGTLLPDTSTPTGRKKYSIHQIIRYLENEKNLIEHRLAQARLIAECQPVVPVKRTELLSVTAFADYIGVSANTLRNWDKSGKLKPYTVSEGGHRFYIKEQAGNLRPNRR